MSPAKKNDHIAVKATIAAAAVLATAAAVFLYGTPQGAKTRKKIKGWTLKAKGEVLEALEKAKDTSEDHYHDIVEKVAARYKKLKTTDAKEVAEFIKEMKQHWKHIAGSVKAPAKKAKSAVKKAAPKKK